MKIAVTYENGQVFQHFGHTEQFKLYEVEGNEVIKSEVVSTNGSGHGALAVLLAKQQVNVLICGGIGAGAQKALKDAHIQFYGGVEGSADEAVADFISNRLSYNENVQCDHHNHEHHQCGDHGCGQHHCHDSINE